MAATRVFFDNKRLSTGVPYKTSWLQVYPTKQIFPSEAEWRTHWTRKMMDLLRFEVEAAIPTNVVANPLNVLPKTNTVVTKPVSTVIVLPPTNTVNTTPAPVVPSISQAPKSAAKSSHPWFCSYCKLPPGNDHRMCVCKAKYSVGMWEAQRLFPNLIETAGQATSKDKWTTNKKLKATLPKGSYYIGDLCYALSDDIYDKVFGGADYESGTYTCDKGSFMVDNTAYGDGAYMGNDGLEYCVDAGIIGIASVNICDKEKFDAMGDIGGGKVYTFNSDVSCKFGRGIFTFECEEFYLVINTQGENEEDW